MNMTTKTTELSDISAPSLEHQMLVAKQRLDMEIERLTSDLNAMIFDLSQDHPDLVQRVTDNSQKTKEDSGGKFKITDAEAKEIWRVIANTCHPDKNRRRDKRLHEMFLKAKTCKDIGDMPSLYFVYLELVDYQKLTSPLAVLMKNSSIIKESLATLQARYQFLLNSPINGIYHVYKESRTRASALYRSYLMSKMQ